MVKKWRKQVQKLFFCKEQPNDYDWQELNLCKSVGYTAIEWHFATRSGFRHGFARARRVQTVLHSANPGLARLKLLNEIALILSGEHNPVHFW